MDGLKGERTEKLLSGTAEKIAKLFEKFTDDLPDTIDRVRGSIHEFFGAFNGSNEKRTGSVAESLGRIAGAFFDIGEVALDKLTPQVSEFLDVMSGAKKAEEVETIAGGVAAIINKVVETSVETVADVSEGFAEFFGIVAKQGLDKQMTPVVNEVVRLIDEFTDSAHTAIDNVTDSLFAFLDGTVEKSHLTPAINGLNQALAKLLGHFSLSLPPQIDDVKTSIDNFFGSLGGWVIDTFITPVINGLQKFIEILEKLASAADTAKSKIREFFDFKNKLPDLQLVNADTGESFGLGDVAKKAASTIGQGIADGVKKAADGMWDFLTSDLDTQVDAVKDLLGINSPSKVFAGIGKNLVLGLEKGWDTEFGGLESQVDRDMRALTGTARIGFEDSAIGRSSAAGISSMFAANETSGRGDPVSINLVLDGDVAATALYDPLRRTAFQKGQGKEAAYA